jgi:hypothetical protein
VTPVRIIAFAICAAASLAAPSPAAPQTEIPKPPPAAEKIPPVKQEKPETPPAPRREAPKSRLGEERPRSDVPVSFPVDI